MAMDQKLVAGAGGAGIVFLAVVFLAILSSRGGRENLEDIQFLRRYVLTFSNSQRERESSHLIELAQRFLTDFTLHTIPAPHDFN